MSIFKKGGQALDSDLQPEIEIESMAEKVADSGVEPGAPNLQTTKKSNTGKVLTYLILFLALVGVILGVFMFLGNSDEPLVQQAEQAPATVSNTKPRNFDLSLPDPEPSTPASEPRQFEPNTEAPAQQNDMMAYVQEPAEPVEDRLITGSVILSFDGSSSSSSGGERQGSGSAEYSTPLSNRLQPTVTASARAGKRNDLTYLMKKGTNIGCTLDTKIVTTHPGITRCLVNKDVYSADGKVLLVERGSEIIGEQTTSLLHGQAKVFVLWNTVTTPHGVTLDIASPSADSLGASGQDAQVDRHFWERFGGAIMLSLIDDGLVIVGDKINENNSSVSYDSTSDSIESMAAEALRNSINIPPTGYVNQGTLLNVMVARDVDFSPVYELVTPYFY